MIESVSGFKRYRVSPTNPLVVQVQEKHRAKWVHFRSCRSAAEAVQVVFDKGREATAQR
jgi:hypothetical protein